MKPKFVKRWNALYDLFDKVKTDKTEVCINKRDDIHITVDSLDRDMSGCGRCGDRYECFHLSGKIRSNYDDDVQDYTATVSQYYMHSCDKDERTTFCPLFKGHMDKPDNCICDRFLDLKFMSARITDVTQIQNPNC